MLLPRTFRSPSPDEPSEWGKGYFLGARERREEGGGLGGGAGLKEGGKALSRGQRRKLRKHPAAVVGAAVVGEVVGPAGPERAAEKRAAAAKAKRMRQKERAGAADTLRAKVTADVAIARQATGAEGFYGSGGYWRKRATEPVPTTRGDRHRQGRQRAAQQVNEKAMQRIEQSREEGNKRLNVGNLKKARKLGRKWGVKRSEKKVKCPLHRDGCGKAAQGNKMVNHIISAHGATLESEGMAAYVAGMLEGLRQKNTMQRIAAVTAAARAATHAATSATGAAQRANESAVYAERQATCGLVNRPYWADF